MRSPRLGYLMSVLLVVAYFGFAPVASAAGAADAAGGQSASDDSKDKDEASPVASSLTQAMDADSGVSIQTLCTNCNNADLSVAGLGNEHVSVVCDGMGVPAGLAQVYLLSIMPPTVIDKVAVTKGAGNSRLDGSSVGGSIEIERRRPQPRTVLNASADTGEYGWSGARFDLSGRSERFGGTLIGSWGTQDVIDIFPGAQARASRAQFQNVLGAGLEDYPTLPEFHRYTVEGRGEVKLGRSQLLSVGVTTYDESQKYGPAGAAWTSQFIDGSTGEVYDDAFLGYNLENVELDRQQYDARYEIGFNNGARFDVSVSWSDRTQVIDETNLVDGGTLDEFQLFYDIDEQLTQAEVSYSHPLGQRAVIRGGASISELHDKILDRNYNITNFSVPLGFRFKEEVTETGAWVESDLAVSSQIELSVGVRYVDFEYDDNESRLLWLTPEEGGICTDPDVCVLPEGDRIVPRAALTWKPVDDFELRFSAGAGYRVPAPSYDEVCCGRRYRNNRGLKLEESESYGVEVTYQPSPEVRLGGSVFTTEFDQLLIKMATFSQAYANTFQNVNVPDARRSSLTLDMNVEATPRMTFKGSISFLESDNTTPGDEIPVVIDPGFVEYRTFVSGRIPYSVDTRGAFGVEITPARGMRIGINTQYTGETLIQRFEEDPLALGILTFEDADDFWVTNVNVTKQFKKGVSFFVGIDNVTDYVQTDLGDPNYDFNWGPLRGRYVYAGLGYNFDANRN